MPDWGGAKEWGEMRGAQAVANVPYFDGVLSDRPFLAGDHFSMADISLFAGLAFADGVKLQIDPALEALADWRERVSQLPAVKNRSGQTFLPQNAISGERLAAKPEVSPDGQKRA